MRVGNIPSLTLRLTALFAAASTVVILVLGYVIGSAVEQHFVEQDLAVLSGKLDQAREALGRVAADHLDALPQQLDDALVGHRGLAIAVVAPDGRTLFATRDAGFPHELLTKPAVGDIVHPIVWKNAREQPFRGIAVRVPVPGAGEAIVAVATDITHHEHFMDSFRTTLWWSVVVAALVTGLLGWLSVRRGLAPLRVMRQKAEAITARRLDARLDLDRAPIELADLVNTLNATFARLEVSFRRLSDFSSDLAHEFRSPVSNLLTQTQVTLSRPRSEEAYRDVLVSNIEEYERLSRMIADMLLLAQAEEGQLPLTFQRLELAPLIGDLLEFYGLAAEDKGVVLAFSGEGAIDGDPLMIRRAIGNLLSNAIRHAETGSRVNVNVRRDEARMTIVVANVGQTIPADALPRLFDRFYRGDSARTGGRGQTGLGLAIVKSIVEAHGGTVSVTSVAGMTKFLASFPGDVQQKAENG